jgi:hypothetical protein
MRRPHDSTPELGATPLDRLACVLESRARSPEVWGEATWLVLLAHVMHGCRDGRAWPLVPTLAAKLNLQPRVVKAARARLIAAGLLEPMGPRRGGRSRSTPYQVVPDARPGDADRWLARGRPGHAETVHATDTLCDAAGSETVLATDTYRSGNGARDASETVFAARRNGAHHRHPESEGTRREPPLPPKVTSAALSASGDPDRPEEGHGELRVHREERLRAVCTARGIQLHPMRGGLAISELARDRIEPQDLDRWIGAELAAPDGTPTAIAAAIEACIAAAALRRARDDPPDPRRQAASLATADTPTTPQTTPAAQCGT